MSKDKTEKRMSKFVYLEDLTNTNLIMLSICGRNVGDPLHSGCVRDLLHYIECTNFRASGKIDDVIKHYLEKKMVANCVVLSYPLGCSEHLSRRKRATLSICY